MRLCLIVIIELYMYNYDNLYNIVGNNNLGLLLLYTHCLRSARCYTASIFELVFKTKKLLAYM